MFGAIWDLATLMVAFTAGVFTFGLARGFVRRRLRFVDAVKAPLVPLIVGVGVALVAWPLAILPLVTGFTAALIGVGAGLGTASGVKALKRGE